MEEVAAVVRDLVRGAWDVWMMFVDRSARAANKRTVNAIESPLQYSVEERKEVNGPRSPVPGSFVLSSFWPGSL